MEGSGKSLGKRGRKEEGYGTRWGEWDGEGQGEKRGGSNEGGGGQSQGDGRWGESEGDGDLVVIVNLEQPICVVSHLLVTCGALQ